ncbi:MAG: hypothetical protein OEM15_06795 [Myxococcales bacterium]|nr:hypothetical protein [Myxococcales bacterium]MDH3483342.1 hypothetical protein [Myxococcales bacterium]
MTETSAFWGWWARIGCVPLNIGLDAHDVYNLARKIDRFDSRMLTAGGFFSQPIRPQEVRFTYDGDSFAGAPDQTLGWFTALGFRMPLVYDSSPATKPAFVFGFRAVGAVHDEPGTGFDDRYHNVYFVGTFGFEYIFGGDRKLS